MEDSDKIAEELFPRTESYAADEYAKAKTLEELHLAAGKVLAMHATAISTAIRLPLRGKLVLCVMERLAPSSWREFWTLNNNVFCAAALVDLCEVRSLLRSGGRWPELSPLIFNTFTMSGVYLANSVRMNAREKEMFYNQATVHELDFRETDRTTDEQVQRLMRTKGLQKGRMDIAAFIRLTTLEATWLDPWALVQHYDRLAAMQHQE